MATHHGKEGTIKIGSNTVAEIVSFSLDETANIVSDTAMGDSWESKKAGTNDSSGSITCHWDETDTNGQGAMTVGATVTLNLYPEGADSGDTYASMSALVNSVGISVPMDGVVERSFGFESTGGVTWTTV